jgi:hypothetical protein
MSSTSSYFVIFTGELHRTKYSGGSEDTHLVPGLGTCHLLIVEQLNRIHEVTHFEMQSRPTSY